LAGAEELERPNAMQVSNCTRVGTTPHSNRKGLGMTDDKIDQAELDRYGIERIPAEVFLWGGYRYSSARDALAAAKRNAKS